MKTSRFTIYIPDFPGQGKTLIFNTRTQAQVVVDQELKDAIDSLPKPPSSQQAATACDRLREMGILTEDGADEERDLERWFAGIKEDVSVLRPTVLTTYACNFACTYCVEEGVKAPVFMDEETARESVAFIIARFHEYGSKRIFLSFYGGEPMLNMPIIRSVAKSMKEFSLKSGVPFNFGMSTNGSLLTRSIVQELKLFGLAGVKITLDGPREVHDSKRPFKNGTGSWDTLIANIQGAADLIDVEIGCNFDAQNAGTFAALLDDLANMGLARKLHKVILKPISPVPKDREGLVPQAELPCAYSDAQTIRWIVELRRIALEKGFRVDEGVGAHLCDLLMKRTSFNIDPEGFLYRCAGFVGRPEYRCGDIRAEKPDRFLGMELWRRCAGCAYAPLCGDGCVLGAYVRFGDPFKLNCNKEFMEYLVKENLKVNYLRARGAASS